MSDYILENLGFVLELPLSAKEARTRQLPESVGKLLLYAIENTKEKRSRNLMRLAQWLWRWVRSDEALYASPIVPYLSEKKMVDYLASSGLEENTVQIDAQTYLIHCPSEKAILSLLECCTSEAIVFMIDTDGCSAHETLVSVVEFAGDYRGHETPFMRRLGAHGGFFFFAETHESLEVLGTEAFIRRRCLGPLFDQAISASDSTAN